MALRERKKDQTREALAQAAFELFRQKGFEATTAAEIAAAANVSRRTFFRYFPSKDELLFIDNGPRLARFCELLSQREPGEHAFAPVRRACLSIAEEYMGERDKILARLQIIEASPVLGKQERQADLEWERAIARALLVDIPAPSPRIQRKARLLAGATFGAIRATLGEWLMGGGDADLVERAREGLELFTSAIDTELREQSEPELNGTKVAVVERAVEVSIVATPLPEPEPDSSLEPAKPARAPILDPPSSLEREDQTVAAAPSPHDDP